MAELAEQPLMGTGPGRAVLRWRDDRGQTLQARFVHNEYLQVAVELGLIGAAALLVALIAVGRAVWQGRDANGVSWAGVVAALVATAVHGGIDFVWHLPAIPFVTMLLAGTVTVPHMVGGRPVPDPAGSVASTTVQ
jgi:O-antigen ligase